MEKSENLYVVLCIISTYRGKGKYGYSNMDSEDSYIEAVAGSHLEAVGYTESEIFSIIEEQADEDSEILEYEPCGTTDSGFFRRYISIYNKSGDCTRVYSYEIHNSRLLPRENYIRDISENVEKVIKEIGVKKLKEYYDEIVKKNSEK